MTSSRFVRGAKTRMIACVCLIFLLGALVYVFHGTQSKLADVQKIANACTQQTESLSAQFQVLFEYKLRLEKSLQTEKKDHKKAVEDAEKKMKEEKEVWEKERHDFKAKLEARTEDFNSLKTKFDESKEDFEKRISELTAERDQLKGTVDALSADSSKLVAQRNTLKERVSVLEEELERYKTELTGSKGLPADARLDELSNQLADTKKSLALCMGNKEGGRANEGVAQNREDTDMKHALEPPSEVGGDGSKGSSSTTPAVNPQAVSTDSSLRTPTKQTNHTQKRDEILLNKKSTPESRAEPLVMPAANGMAANEGMMVLGAGQIPGPPDDSIPPAKLLINQEESVMEKQQPDTWEDNKKELNNNAAEEINEFPIHQDETKVERSRGNYREREYKDDQGDEDDDDGERMGEYGNGPHLRRDQISQFSNMDGGEGVMLSPK